MKNRSRNTYLKKRKKLFICRRGQKREAKGERYTISPSHLRYFFPFRASRPHGDCGCARRNCDRKSSRFSIARFSTQLFLSSPIVDLVFIAIAFSIFSTNRLARRRCRPLENNQGAKISRNGDGDGALPKHTIFHTLRRCRCSSRRHLRSAVEKYSINEGIRATRRASATSSSQRLLRATCALPPPPSHTGSRGS